MRKIVAALLLSSVTVAGALAQISGGYGPGPTPDPWVFDGSNLSYSQGGISLPSSVTGGDKGIGSLNVQRLYINGASFTLGGALTITGTGPTTFALPTGATTFTFPASTGTVALLSNNLGQFGSTTSAQLASVVSNETGSGALVFGTSPTLVTPVLGAATATTINGNAITTGTGTLTLGSGKTLTANNTLALSGADGSTLTLGGSVAHAGAFSQTFTATGNTSLTLPTIGTLATLSNNLGQFGATTSAQLAGVISDETGSGSMVFGTSPAISAPALSGTSTGTYTLGGTPTLAGGTLTGNTTLPGTGQIGNSGKLSVGLGRAPDAWGGTFMPIQFGPNSVAVDGTGVTAFGRNWYNDGTTDRYSNLAGPATKYAQSSGAHIWYYSLTGAVGAAISFVQSMQTSPTTGALLINTATDDGVNKLQVNGSVKATTVTAGTLTATGAARVLATNTSGQSIPSNVSTTVTGWVNNFDANSNFNAATGVFTAPQTGFYLVTSQLVFNGAMAVGTELLCSVSVNGVAKVSGLYSVDNLTPTVNSVHASALVQATAGQPIVIQAFQNTAAPVPLSTGINANYVSFTQMP